MNPQLLGIIIGGLLPAIVYGLSGVASKASISEGIGLGIYLIIIGVFIALTGIVIFGFDPDKTYTMRAGVYAASFGIAWGLGTAGVAIAMAKYSAPLSKLVPLYNMNTLIAVLLALWIFAEWQQVKVPQLLLGSLLIVVGGTLVARA